MTEPTSAQDLFKGRHFDQEIIILCIRWYLTFKLSSRDLVQMMSERGIALVHTTILRWVQRYVPDFEKRWNQYALPVGDSWRVDETYIKVKGQWVYLYRAVDKQGRTVDFLLSKWRDVATAKRFFSNAAKQHGAPRVITLDGYAASHRAVAELKEVGTLPRRVRIRSSQYLNNVVEQGHRRIKQRIRASGSRGFLPSGDLVRQRCSSRDSFESARHRPNGSPSPGCAFDFSFLF
jgi:transposase-like protein